MRLTTKYDLSENLYFLYKGCIRYLRPTRIIVENIKDSDTSVLLVSYVFGLDKKTTIERHENQVFKRKADLIQSITP